MRMNELYTARYNDGRTIYEKPLDWIYRHQGSAKVEITPCIWLWKSSDGTTFFVDYMGDGVSCTLSTFSSFAEAEKYSEQIGEMTESDFEDWLLNVRWKRNV